ncbi:hypothetical protein ACIPW9_13640 [Streptomyces sp. NPDC090052]|uniref:hypothetical protein n=1 Tax=unclassified Streptomyces TaxID=2593676 RepID=UPI00225AA1E7|nr:MULTISPECIES: hypothetical protein [unclassified Streptomyces]MCX4723117.1 hypothetical protein [Streptomyces sp. NBC_01306]WSV07247.1 hypothetical protein OG372_28845 [Streptomyces sp. NBC_01020]WSX66614.1 hypothetical protein OG221_08285 [Streptomyces sp. NBC_00932]
MSGERDDIPGEPERVRPARSLGRLPTVVRGGATLALLIAVAAVGLLLLPVSPTVPDPSEYAEQNDTVQVTCGSVLRPAGDDALADNRDTAPACGSARIQRMGWSGVGLGSAFVVLVLSLLMGDGMSEDPAPRQDPPEKTL